MADQLAGGRVPEGQIRADKEESLRLQLSTGLAQRMVPREAALIFIYCWKR